MTTSGDEAEKRASKPKAAKAETESANGNRKRRTWPQRRQMDLAGAEGDAVAVGESDE